MAGAVERCFLAWLSHLQYRYSWHRAGESVTLYRHFRPPGGRVTRHSCRADEASLCWSCIQEGKDIPIPFRAKGLNGPLEHESVEYLRNHSPWSTLATSAAGDDSPDIASGKDMLPEQLGTKQAGDKGASSVRTCMYLDIAAADAVPTLLTAAASADERPTLLFYAGEVPTWVGSWEEMERHTRDVTNDIVGRVSLFYYHHNTTDFKVVPTCESGCKYPIV